MKADDIYMILRSYPATAPVYARGADGDYPIANIETHVVDGKVSVVLELGPRLDQEEVNA